jgi:hypothetical protein
MKNLATALDDELNEFVYLATFCERAAEVVQQPVPLRPTYV